MSNKKVEIIDLTSSFSLVNHCNIADEIINLDSDESFEIETRNNVASSSSNKKDNNKRNNLQSIKHKQQKSPVKKALKHQEESPKFGDCPICWNKLGQNQLASTKCGHVYCLICLEKSLKLGKQCPTCRCKLVGKGAYHPLYLN